VGQPEPADHHPGVAAHDRLTAPAWRCRLAPGARLRRVEGRTFLVSERPLAVLELRDRAARLVAGLPPGEEVGQPAPPAAELRFLRRLAELGVLDLRPEPLPETAWPRVTVVVPVRDREAQLAACLASLEQVRYPAGRLEVVVVDDGSARPVAVPAGVRLVRRERSGGPAAARNAGASGCRAELLAFVDSDCAAEPGWLAALVPELVDPAVAAVGGRVLAGRRTTWLERYDSVRSPLDLGPARADARPRRPVPFLVTANLVLRRSAFEAAGGFDEALRCGEDVDLCWRLAAAGHRLVYQPAGRVRHDHRRGPRAFAATRAAYAASEAALLRRHPESGRWLGFSPGLAALAVGGAVGLTRNRPALLAAGALALGVEVAAAAARLCPLGLRPSASAAAILRGQATGLYHAARQLTRYYGLPAAAGALAVLPPGPRRRLLLGLAAAALVPGAVDWWRHEPPLSLPAFLAAQALDDAAYQWGLWRGCARERSLAALAVELRSPADPPP
jgi:mycofactocin system glycosyltransferase